MQREQLRCCSGRTEVLMKVKVHAQDKAAAISPHALKVALPGSRWEGCVLTWLERPLNHTETCHPWHSPPCLLDTDPLPSRVCAAPPTVCAVGCSGSPPPPACGSSLFWGQHVPPARHCGAVRVGTTTTTTCCSFLGCCRQEQPC